MHVLRTALFLLVVIPCAAVAGTEWETVTTGALVVKVRDQAGTPYKEVWAEGEINAPVQDIQATLMTPNLFPRFMPYVKEAALIGLEPDGTQFTYTRLDLPFLTSRDYVLKVTLIKGVGPDGSGEFQNQWVAVPEKIPKRRLMIRLTHNEGSWHVTPKANGKSHAVYRFSFDTGGWVPGFVADMGNKQAVQSTYDAVEKEAQRRAAARAKKERAAAGADAGSAAPVAGMDADAGTTAGRPNDTADAGMTGGRPHLAGDAGSALTRQHGAPDAGLPRSHQGAGGRHTLGKGAADAGTAPDAGIPANSRGTQSAAVP